MGKYPLLYFLFEYSHVYGLDLVEFLICNYFAFSDMSARSVLREQAKKQFEERMAAMTATFEQAPLTSAPAEAPSSAPLPASATATEFVTEP